MNKRELQFARNYIRHSSEDLVMIKKRSKIPFTIMDSVFTRYGLPVELKYLSVIESELKSSARSRVGALGPWQFMAETAHDLGLKITRRYDERTSFAKSTGAAAKYLKDLYAQFDDWLLVVAAYNVGPAPVYAAIRKSGSRNFWALQYYLPLETRLHVKRFIATHYYFEGQGSTTTLTKAENTKYAKSLNAFAIFKTAVSPQTAVTPQPAVNPQTAVNPRKEQKPGTEIKSQKESFKSLTKESAGSLQRAFRGVAA